MRCLPAGSMATPVPIEVAQPWGGPPPTKGSRSCPFPSPRRAVLTALCRCRRQRRQRKRNPELTPADSLFFWSAGVVLPVDLALALPTVAAPSRFLYLTFPVELRRLFFSRGCALQPASMKH